jgi:hypothetical protein
VRGCRKGQGAGEYEHEDSFGKRNAAKGGAGRALARADGRADEGYSYS